MGYISFEEGDRVQAYSLPTSGYVKGTVLNYDRNDGPEWPDGCCGDPFVDVKGDDGKTYTSFAYRWEAVPDDT